MVEATPSIHPQPSVVIATLARQAAMKAAKAQLRERAQAALHVPARAPPLGQRLSRPASRRAHRANLGESAERAKSPSSVRS
jgi:hypothetical protein